MLTIFTPTYNRAYILDKLYLSLCIQTNKDFEWLIIDDGSTDNTKEKIQKWISEKKIQIRYVYQKNAGKSAAHNRALELTKTELFVCVDSDDQLHENAVAVVLEEWDKLRKQSKQEVGGMVAFREMSDGTPITQYQENLDCKVGKLKEFYDRKIISGDTMLIFDVSKVGSLRFPAFEGEKFVPEAYLYDQFDQISSFLIVPQYIYICEYLEDGYTQNMARLIAKNPNGYLAYIEQRIKYDNDIKNVICDTIRYIAIAVCAKKKNIIKSSYNPLCAFVMYPFGKIFYRIRYKKYYTRREYCEK